MSSALAGLKQIGDFLNPKTMKRLRQAGMVDPKGPLGIGYTLPWLVGRGPSLGILSQMHSLVLRNKTAIIDGQGEITWAELDARANQVAHALKELGVTGGDRLATLIRNGREAAEIALGAQKIGVICCPMNTWAKPKELKSTLEQADPTILIYDTRHADQVKEAAHEGPRLLHIGKGEGVLSDSTAYGDVVSKQSKTPPFPFTRNVGSAKVVIHTSGTTGTPKGAQRDASAAGVGAMSNLLERVPYHRDDVIFIPAPMFHSFGLISFTLATALGATMVLPEKFDPEGSLEWIEKHHCTAASFIPVMIKRIVTLDDDVKQKYDLSSLRVILASGSAMSPELRKAAMETFGDVLYDLYGSTEVGWASIATPEDMKKKPKTVGRPVDGIEIGVFSKEGDKLPVGETGELFIKSDVLFEGYTSGDSRDMREGYMSIGDLGHLDEDGHLFVEGRADDMVVVGGENIYPIEVEEVIESIDGVDDVAVLGVEDEEFGQVLAAFVVGSASEDEIKKRCKDELASYKVPRRIDKLDELPRTSTGKVLKRELIDNAEGVEPLDA